MGVQNDIHIQEKKEKELIVTSWNQNGAWTTHGQIKFKRHTIVELGEDAPPLNLFYNYWWGLHQNDKYS